MRVGTESNRTITYIRIRPSSEELPLVGKYQPILWRRRETVEGKTDATDEVLPTKVKHNECAKVFVSLWSQTNSYTQSAFILSPVP